MQIALLQGDLSSQVTVTLGPLFPSLGWVSGFSKNWKRSFSLLRTRKMHSINCPPLFTQQSCLPGIGLELTATAPCGLMQPRYGESAAGLSGQQLSLLSCLHSFLMGLGRLIILGDLALRLLIVLKKNCDQSVIQFSCLVFLLFLESGFHVKIRLCLMLSLFIPCI